MEEINKHFNGKYSEAAIANSIKMMRQSNVLEMERDGRTPIYRLNRDNPMTSLALEILESIESESNVKKTHVTKKAGVAVTV